MTSADYSTIPSSALVALAQLILTRAKLSLPCTTREQALRVIQGVKPAPPRRSPLNINTHVPTCFVCHKPMPNGSLCDSLGRVHINCQGDRNETRKA